MARTCIVNLSTNIVENVAEMGGSLPPNASQPAQPPEGYAWIEHPTAGIGWTHADGVLTNPSPQPTQSAPTAEEMEAAFIAALNDGSNSHPIDLLKALKAHAIRVECDRLGINPNAITPAQLNTLRQRIAVIYKAL